MTNKKCKRLNFSLSEETVELLRELGKKTELKLSTVVKKAIEEYAKNH